MDTRVEWENDTASGVADLQPLLAFIHIPKTGGTSLEGVFQQNDGQMFNIRHPDQLKTFLNLPGNEQEKFDGIFGHMPFGIDRLISRPVTYITFLRDPVERVLSAYAHNLRHPEEPGAEVIRQRGLAWTAQPADFMCRFLAHYDLLDEPTAEGGYWASRNPPAFVPREYLEQAKDNLDKCAFIGLTEHYDADIRALEELQGHHIRVPQAVPRAKVGTNRIRQSDLTKAQVQAIRAANRLDLELYEYAQSLRAQWGGPLRRSGTTSLRSRVSSGVVQAGPSPPGESAPAAVEADPPPRVRGKVKWTATDLDWQRLPDQTPAGPLPQTFKVDGPVYMYAAATGLLPAEPHVLRIQAKVTAGAVGILVTTPDGQTVLSPERILEAGPDEVRCHIAITTEMAPAILVVRNQQPDGAVGSIWLRQVESAPAGAVASADLDRIEAAPSPKGLRRLLALFSSRPSAPSTSAAYRRRGQTLSLI